jgi:hypothetical protein
LNAGFGRALMHAFVGVIQGVSVITRGFLYCKENRNYYLITLLFAHLKRYNNSSIRQAKIPYKMTGGGDAVWTMS